MKDYNIGRRREENQAEIKVRKISRLEFELVQEPNHAGRGCVISAVRFAWQLLVRTSIRP